MTGDAVKWECDTHHYGGKSATNLDEKVLCNTLWHGHRSSFAGEATRAVLFVPIVTARLAAAGGFGTWKPWFSAW